MFVDATHLFHHIPSYYDATHLFHHIPSYYDETHQSIHTANYTFENVVMRVRNFLEELPLLSPQATDRRPEGRTVLSPQATDRR